MQACDKDTILVVGGAVISLLSLGVSVVTMYFAWLRRGSLRMTKPSILFFGFDETPKRTAKVFIRTLLYSSSAKGQVIETMYAKLYFGGNEQIFSFWGYMETNELMPGSGLFVGQTGVVASHHFVQSAHHPTYQFAAGTYAVEVYASLVGQKAPIRLARISLTVDSRQAEALGSGSGVLFELQPDSGSYVGHLNNEGHRG